MMKHSGRFLAVTAMAALVCLLTIGQAGAWEQDDLDKLIETNACENCNLSGVELISRDLENAQLSGADLSDAKLTSANLDNADLSGTDLRSATLINASFIAANLRDATNVDSANFTGADLSGATWTDGRQCKPNSIGQCK